MDQIDSYCLKLNCVLQLCTKAFTWAAERIWLITKMDCKDSIDLLSTHSPSNARISSPGCNVPKAQRLTNLFNPDFFTFK